MNNEPSESWIHNGKVNNLKSTEFVDSSGETYLISDANGNEWVKVKDELAECFSCDKEFEAEDHNNLDCGTFCDSCLENPEDR